MCTQQLQDLERQVDFSKMQTDALIGYLESVRTLIAHQKDDVFNRETIYNLFSVAVEKSSMIYDSLS